MSVRELKFTDAYLKRTQDKVKHQPHIRLYVTRHEGEDDVVYPKQGLRRAEPCFDF